jgi:hypothetical protein
VGFRSSLLKGFFNMLSPLPSPFSNSSIKSFSNKPSPQYQKYKKTERSASASLADSFQFQQKPPKFGSYYGMTNMYQGMGSGGDDGWNNPNRNNDKKSDGNFLLNLFKKKKKKNNSDSNSVIVRNSDQQVAQRNPALQEFIEVAKQIMRRILGDWGYQLYSWIRDRNPELVQRVSEVREHVGDWLQNNWETVQNAWQDHILPALSS